MGWHNIKLDPVDILFSTYIRRLRGKCDKCGRLGYELKNGFKIGGLEASHFHSRKKENTRFDPQNVDCLCKSCHKRFHEHKKEYEAWKLEKLGQRDYDLLQIASETYKKKDRKMDLMVVRVMYEELKFKLANNFK